MSEREAGHAWLTNQMMQYRHALRELQQGSATDHVCETPCARQCWHDAVKLNVSVNALLGTGQYFVQTQS